MNSAQDPKNGDGTDTSGNRVPYCGSASSIEIPQELEELGMSPSDAEFYVEVLQYFKNHGVPAAFLTKSEADSSKK